MAIVDIEQPSYTPARVASDDIRRLLGSVLGHAESSLMQIHGIVRDHGRSSIASELVPDASVFLSVVESLRAAVQAGKEVTIDELPE